MANDEFTSRQKHGVYRLLLILNGSLRFVVGKLEEITASKVFDPAYLKELKDTTDKIETEINALLNPE